MSFAGPERLDEVLDLKPGDHLCLVYDEDPAEQLPALLPYIAQGLDQGERCVYVADDLDLGDLRIALREYGVDVASEETCGALWLWTRHQWRQPGELESALKAAQLKENIALALDDGFNGIRFAIEMTWTLGPEVDARRLRYWEASVNSILTPETPARIVCQYSRRRLPQTAIETGILTHPVVVLGTDVCPNPFYDAPRVLAAGQESASGEGGSRPEWMLSQIRWARAYEVERRERRRAEADRAAAEDLLRRAEALRQAAELVATDLKKANDIKDEFLGLVSHELRTPIATVIGNALLLQKRSDRLAESDKQQCFEDLVAEAGRLQRIVENLLLITRTQLSTLQRKPVDLEAVIGEGLKALHERNPGRQVLVEIEPNHRPALAEPTLLALVLDNLVSNADKYSPPDRPIEVKLSRGPEGGPEIRVRDYGIGLSSEEEEQVFVPFFRSALAKATARGTGLGLAVCRRVVEAQNGRIRAHGRPEGGSDFVFSLEPAPAVRASDASTAEAASALT